MTPTKVKSAMKHAFKWHRRMYCITCKACGNSFYMFDPNLSSQPSLGNPSSTQVATCAMADATVDNDDYTWE